MKKYIIIISVIFSVQLSAQTYQDFAPTGASWWYSMHDLGYTYELAGVDLLHIESIGDTLIGGRECKILHKKYYEKDAMKDTRLDFCYSEAGKVYYWINEEWRLLYDFTASEGDTIRPWAEDTLLNVDHFKEFERSYCNLSEDAPANALGLIYYVVTQKNKRTINGLDLKDYFAYPNDYAEVVEACFYMGVEGRVIERIGSTRSMLGVCRGCLTSDQEIDPFLICYEDEDIFYQSPNIPPQDPFIPGDWAAPFPVCDIDIIDSIEEVSLRPGLDYYWQQSELQLSPSLGVIEISVYDLAGRVVLQQKTDRIDLAQLKKGLYIVQLGAYSLKFVAGYR